MDGPVGQFDSSPGTVRGCQFIDGCWVLTPYIWMEGDHVLVALARNFEPVDGDSDGFDEAFTRIQVGITDPVGGGVFPIGTPGYTYAVWSCSPCTSVPEPTTIALLIAVLPAAIAIRRGARRRSSLISL